MQGILLLFTLLLTSSYAQAGGGQCAYGTCQNGGTCTSTTSTYGNSYYCTCPPGYRGTNCETYVDVGQCTYSPCQNGGTCTPNTSPYGNWYYCTCTYEYSGMNCEAYIVVGNCAYGPCQNGATCTSATSIYENAYYCTCAPGYSGTNCETYVGVGDCFYGPCTNGGTCTPTRSSYYCTCASGYSGMNCETYVGVGNCAYGPCQNGAMCTSYGNSYYCTCALGYGGVNCETYAGVGACAYGPCVNGGTCIPTTTTTGSSFYCICASGYNGMNCEIDIRACPDGTPPVRCFVNPCDVTMCQSRPDATCRANYCGGCHAEFYDRYGGKVDCNGDSTSCSYSGITYLEGESRPQDCNTCSCHNKQWICTLIGCGKQELIVVSVTFYLDGDYDGIAAEKEEFRNELIESISAKFQFPKNMIHNIKLSKGSIRVEFDLMEDPHTSNIDVQAVAAYMEDKISNYTFIYNGVDYSVKPDSPKFDKVYKDDDRRPKWGDMKLSLPLLIGVIIAAVVFITIVVIIIIVAVVFCSKKKSRESDYQYSGEQNGVTNVSSQAYNNHVYEKTLPNKEYTANV